MRSVSMRLVRDAGEGEGMKESFERLIDLHDQTLGMLRTQWMVSVVPDEKKKWMEKINLALEERYRLMKFRDIEPELEDKKFDKQT